MGITLSPRLQVCCGLVAPGERVADVGCDHGYLSIHLLQTGTASYVYAGDVNEGPLQSAVRNAAKYGVSDKIQFFLSDGLKGFPRDFDTLVCAGMGADTIMSILQNAPWLKSSQYRLILQCQSRTPFLRKYLSDNDFRIYEEAVVRDGRFLYTVMEAGYRPGFALTPAECHFPPALLENPSTELPAYYRQVLSRLQRAVDGQAEHADAEKVRILQELKLLAQQPELSFLKEEQG